jgi:hypothetical protein
MHSAQQTADSKQQADSRQQTADNKQTADSRQLTDWSMVWPVLSCRNFSADGKTSMYEVPLPLISHGTRCEPEGGCILSK